MQTIVHGTLALRAATHGSIILSKALAGGVSRSEHRGSGSSSSLTLKARGLPTINREQKALFHDERVSARCKWPEGSRGRERYASNAAATNCSATSKAAARHGRAFAGSPGRVIYRLLHGFFAH